MNNDIPDPYDFLDDPEPDGFSWITEEEVIYRRRWSTLISRVAQKKEDKTFWLVSYEVCNTEYQEVELNLGFTQVYPKAVTKTIYTTNK